MKTQGKDPANDTGTTIGPASSIVVNAGNTVMSPDVMYTLTIPELAKRIRSGEHGLEQLQQHLRQSLAMDKKFYDNQKTRLPFFCMGLFAGNKRSRSNLTSAQLLVMDLDKVPAATLASLKAKATQDPQVLMAFTSPSGQGLKVVFCTTHPIFDALQYANLYKTWARQFAIAYDAEQWVDFKTHDASRVCFLAHDPELHLNLDAMPLVLAELDNPDALLDNLQSDLSRAALKQRAQPRAVGEKPSAPKDTTAADPERENHLAEPLVPYATAGLSVSPIASHGQVPAQVTSGMQKAGGTHALSKEQMTELLQLLNPHYKSRPKVELVVPEALDAMLPEVNSWAVEHGFELRSVKNISYGKALTFYRGHAFAEINVFYGKRGYSVVKTTKRGSSAELAELCAQLLYHILY